MPKSQQQDKNNPGKVDSVRFGKELLRIARTRTRLLVCFWTLPLYVIAIWVLLNNGRDVDAMMWVYMAIYAVFALDMAMRNCPNCHKQFYVKNIFLNLITKQCVHCGQSLSHTNSSSKD